ncbi:MAG: hypothetical protein GF346_12180 [Candidatus Eisenbacteria bacterium]|nr:hypothetical protein [Candidatus Latescibacterota bacterium]MBD3303195.1 hypothetical protein [Candidatus Eisenbacteria bacterium]
MRLRVTLHPILILLICLSSAVPAIAAGDGSSVGWTWDQVDLIQTRFGETEIRVDGARLAPTAPGEPALPAALVRVPAPDGANVASFRLTGAVTSVGTLTDPVAPTLQDAPSTAGGPRRVEPLRSAYEVPAFPDRRVQFLGLTLRRGEAYANFAVYPVVLEEGERLVLLEGAELEVEWRADPEVPIPLKTLRGSRESALGKGDAGETAGALQISEMPALESAPVEYLIVTIDEFEPLLEPFVQWKSRSGTPTTVRSVSWILEHYPSGVDTQERIRTFIQEAYRYWGVEWLLIVGGPDEVPIRTARSYSYISEGVDIITDLYYACLDGNWNRDGDSIFGEAMRSQPPNIGDNVDFGPEVMVGRIPATNTTQLNAWLRSYFRYTQDPITDGYLEKILLLGEVLFDSEWIRAGLPKCGVTGECPYTECESCVRMDGAQDCIDVIDVIEDVTGGQHEFEYVELYEYYEYWRDHGRPNCILETYANVVNEINAGAGLVHHVGHGDRDRMSIGTQQGMDGNGRYVVADAKAMANGSRVGVVYSINCNSAAIDFDCLAEATLFAEEGGMVSYIGSSNLDFPTAARPYMIGFYERAFGREVDTIGEAFLRTLEEQMAGQDNVEGFRRFLAYSLIFLGDPQLSLWLSNPGMLEVTASSSVPLGTTEPLRVEVREQSGGQPVEGATVCAHKQGDTFVVGETGANGLVDLAFRPTGTGRFRITVTHPEAKPHFENTTTRQVTPPTGEQGALSVDAIPVNDVESGESDGNGNGRFELGETVKLDVKLDNDSSQGINDIALSFSLEPAELRSFFEVADSTESVATINGSSTVQVSGAFLLRALSAPPIPDESFQNGDRLPLVAHVGLRVGDGEEEIFEVPLPVYRPLLDLEQGGLVEIAGNGDGVPQDGETFQWTPILRNIGTGTAASLQGVLTAESGAAIETGTVPLESAERGQLLSIVGGEDPFEFVVIDAAVLRLHLTIRSPYDPGFSFLNRTIDLEPPAAPDIDTSEPPAASQDAVELEWMASPSTDVHGYVVESSTQPDDGFAQASVGLVRDMLYHRSEGLDGLTRYYFRVAAIDSSGNRSAYSPVTSATTTPGSLPGWPFAVQGEMGLGCPTIENIDGSGDHEIFLTANLVYGMNPDGTEIIDGDGVSSTRGIWSTEGGGFWSKPAVGDLDGDGTMELVATSRYRVGNAGVGHLYVWDASGDLIWFKPVTDTNFLIASPVIANLDEDPQAEVVVHVRGALFAWNHDGSPVVPANPDGRLAFVGGDHPTDVARWPYTWGSPAVADLDGDGDDEVLVSLETNLSGGAEGYHPSRLAVIDGDGTILDMVYLEVGLTGGDATSSNSSPSLADVDDDSLYEIFVATRNHLWAFYYNDLTGELEPEPGWPEGGKVSIPSLPTNWTEPTPGIGDVDGDTILDVVLGVGFGQVIAVRGPTGETISSFPHLVAAADSKVGSPVLVQMDDDPAAEILVGDKDGYLYALDAQTMEQLPGFPLFVTGRLEHGVNVWDVDRDGFTNIVVQAYQNSNVLVLDYSTVEFPDDLSLAMQRNPWSSYRHDARNTGTLDKAVITPVRLLAVEALARGNQVALTWDAPVAPSRFRVERQGSDGVWRSRIEAPAGDLRFEGVYRFDDEADPGRYLYRVTGFDSHGGTMYRSAELAVSVERFRLALNGVAPNPFNPRTAIRFQTPGQRIVLEILDPGGRRIRTLADRAVPAGVHERVWDGRDDEGREVGSGVYWVRLKGEGFEESRKMVLLR